MIWLTWRQFRAQAAVMSGFLAVLAAVLAVTGYELSNDYSHGIATCKTEEACQIFTQNLFEDYKSPFLILTLLVLVLPAVIGLFWGAPLVARELEAGTHRLAWNQSVTRTRWLTVKLALVGTASVLAATLGSLMVNWWISPLDKSAADQFVRMSPLLFDTRGITAVGYAAFAFVLGVTIGMVARRTLVAMTLTMVVFVLLQVVMPLFVRPHLLPATTLTTQITRDNLDSLMSEGPSGPVRIRTEAPDPKAWVLTNQTVDPSGKAVESIPFTTFSQFCGPQAEGPPPPEGGAAPRRPPGPPQACVDAINKLGYQQRITYHPDSRFWSLQLIETGVFVALAAGLAGFSFWWLRRRVS
ncbi:ABC transporter permease subunit [Spirillospora sp. NPDC047279]|uniref:ABC transporter permease subunit n=1 Tax=Spirillospora sp. NPDC047279 TaxID=3155478 RepID=UPI003411F526